MQEIRQESPHESQVGSLDLRTAIRASPPPPAEGWDPNLLGEKQSPHKENYEPQIRHTESRDLVIRSGNVSH